MKIFVQHSSKGLRNIFLFLSRVPRPDTRWVCQWIINEQFKQPKFPNISNIFIFLGFRDRTSNSSSPSFRMFHFDERQKSKFLHNILWKTYKFFLGFRDRTLAEFANELLTSNSSSPSFRMFDLWRKTLLLKKKIKFFFRFPWSDTCRIRQRASHKQFKQSEFKNITNIFSPSFRISQIFLARVSEYHKYF